MSSPRDEDTHNHRHNEIAKTPNKSGADESVMPSPIPTYLYASALDIDRDEAANLADEVKLKDETIRELRDGYDEISLRARIVTIFFSFHRDS